MKMRPSGCYTDSVSICGVLARLESDEGKLSCHLRGGASGNAGPLPDARVRVLQRIVFGKLEDAGQFASQATPIGRWRAGVPRQLRQSGELIADSRGHRADKWMTIEHFDHPTLSFPPCNACFAASAISIKVKPYDIPLRTLIAKDVVGLMMVGRSISGDFIAHASDPVTVNNHYPPSTTFPP